MKKVKTLIAIILFLYGSIIFARSALAGVSIDSPAAGSTVGGIVPVTVSFQDASPEHPIRVLYLSINGPNNYHVEFNHAVNPPAVSGAYTFSWDTSGCSDASGYQLSVLATSLDSGVPGFSDAITVAVNNPPPVIAFVTPVDGSYIPPIQATLAVTISFHNVMPNYHGINYVVLQTSVGHVLAGYPSGSPTSGTYTWNLNFASFPMGSSWLKASCSDTIGKSSNVTINIIKGEPPPTVVDPKLQPSQKDIEAVGHPINVANGNMFTSHKDISIPARENPLELSRTYNSNDDYNGQFGYGWRSNFDITLKEYPDGSVVEVDETGVYTVYSKNPDLTYTPSAGKHSTLTKNPDNTYLIVRKGGKKLYFDAQGRLIQIEGRNGNAITILRDANGVIQEVTEPSGRKLLFTNSSGRTTQIADPAGRLFQYAYDANGNLIQVTDPANNSSSYQYNNHKLTVETDANGHSFNFEYNADNRAYHSWQEGNNNSVNLVFDPANSKTTVTDSRGNAVVYEYNTYGLVTKITDAQNHTQLIAWDGNMNKTSVTDQNSHTATYTYDARGNLLTSADPLGNTTTFTYESVFDFIKTSTDAQNNITTYGYDAKGNLTKLTDALGHFTTNVYDNLGQLTSSTNPKSFTTAFTYDDYGNPATTADALGNITTFTCDILGNRTQTKDAKNNITQFTYNNLYQLTQITYPDSSTNTFTYDALGNKLSSADSAGNTTTYAYDLDNRLTSTINPLNKTLTFEYDTEGNRTKVIDQSLHETVYQYDSLNRLVFETNPLGLSKSYAYDPAGNRTSITDAKGNTITYEYDNVNRLKNINYPDSSSVTFTYDSWGRRVSMVDTQGATNYTYDKLNRLTQVDGPKDNDTLQYAYDEQGNRTSLILPDGKIVHYAYDALNRINSITDSNNKTTNYNYDEVGSPVNVNYPNNIQAVYAFDALHRLIRLANQNQNTQTKLSEFIYTYDSAGRRTRVESLDGTTDYTYDALSELTAEVKNSTTSPYQITYEYDPSGNRTRMLKNGAEHLYSYNNANQLTQEDITGPAQMPVTVTGTVSDANGIQSLTVNGNAATLNGNNFTAQINLSSGPNSINVTATDVAGNTATKSINVTYAQTDQILYLYDNNGNLIKKQSSAKTLNLGYDYENRLNNSNSNGVNITYGYDGEGKRISTVNGSNTTNYLYDGLDVVLERNSSGDPVANYLRNPDAPGGIGGIINSQQGSTPENYYSYDGLGSVANLSDNSGTDIQSYAYDAFGNLLIQPNSINATQFLTKEADSTGLIYFGRRYYDPTIGRFITQDPSGMIDGPNVYLYCLNNPVNLVDLWGLCKKDLTWWEWWLLEMPLPGWYYGQPMSEWASYSSTGLYSPMEYTEQAGGVWMWAERGAIGTSAVAVLSAGGLMAANVDPWVGSLQLHPANHTFPLIGNQPHLQLIIRNFLRGIIKAKNFNFRIPIGF